MRKQLHLYFRAIRFFFQRLFRGWDDSQTWSLDVEFYKWLRPRLKRFGELTIAYPGNEKYPTLKSWQMEINKRVSQLDHLIKEDDECFENKMHEDFHKWFAKECGWLWW